MKAFIKYTAAVLLFSTGIFAAYAQNYTAVIEKARDAYKAESFELAFSIVASGIPETIGDSGVKRDASEFLSSIGAEEYSIRNFKNSYEAFRKALKYDPTNTQATSYFLKIRREMNVMALTNEAPPRAKPVPAPPASAPAPVEAPAAQNAAAPPAAADTEAQPSAPAPVTQAPLPSPPIEKAKIDELKLSLEIAEARMKNMESSVSSTSDENKVLRGQVEQQMTLLQKFMDKQAEALARPAAAPAPQPSAQSEQEKALIARTMEILAKVSEKETPPPQVVVQSDPAVKDLVEKFGSVQDDLKRSNSRSAAAMIVTAVVAALLLGILLFFMYIAMRRRKTGRANDSMMENRGQGMAGLPSYSPTANFSGETPLLEFVDSGSSAPDGNRDFSIRRDLLKAERLNRLYAEVQAGTLGWNTVRQYIGELEVSLKTEILKTVERKLDEGDLISSEAILPVIFPFLTDYDDYIRQKSEKLAERALTGTSAKTASARLALPGGSGKDEERDALSLESLLEIPKKLQIVYKDHDLTLVTAKICRGMGTVLGLSPEDRNLLYLTALAHDCGYLAIDSDRLARITSKKEIDEDEFDFLKTHVSAGLEYFKDTVLPEEFKNGILYHHERNDGSGYPQGMKKEEIPLFAKIIGVAETFATLTANRPYRNKWTKEQALSIISDGARSKFDPEHVTALVKVATSMGEGK